MPEVSLQIDLTGAKTTYPDTVRRLRNSTCLELWFTQECGIRLGLSIDPEVWLWLEEAFMETARVCHRQAKELQRSQTEYMSKALEVYRAAEDTEGA